MADDSSSAMTDDDRDSLGDADRMVYEGYERAKARNQSGLELL